MCARRYDSGAVNEVDPASKRDVLPDFGLAWNGRDSADFAAFQSIYHAALANVWVANEAN